MLVVLGGEQKINNTHGQADAAGNSREDRDGEAVAVKQ